MALVGPGTRISDTLVVDRMLGEGTFAEVYRVEHAHLGWQAMKLFKKAASPEEIRPMLQEARLLSTMGHPNIVRLFDAGTVATTAGLRGYFTMEYVAGGSVAQLLAAHRSGVPVEVAVTVLEQIAAGLAVAHDRSPPVLHRDLTPPNVLVGYDGTGLRVRISDFGLARRADPLTLIASAQGTYAFLAPEVLRGGGYSCAADVWSVGTVAYLLLTDRFPYDDGSALSSYSTARFQRELRPPSSFNDDVDAGLDAVVSAALDVDPRRRLPTAGAFGDALRTARQTAGAAPARHTPSRVEPSRRARLLATEALTLARHPDGLARAADLMEEAVNLSPTLRETYLPRLTAWRRGVTM
jgi:eukaryotic-like serine/threonine-protein kinase